MGYVSIFIHIIFTAFMVVAPFYTNNANLLMILIFMNACLLTEWYVLGGSVLNNYDHYAYTWEEKYQYHTGLNASIPVICVHKLTGCSVELLGKITACVPLALITFMLWKIYNMQHKKLKYLW
jgi:hypothetical protein